MNTQLLQQWLDLPAGAWPPPAPVLLGIATTSDAAEAERKALKLMSKLRPHQLLHPELVTEGMNRLAQAMLSFARTTNIEPFPFAPVPVVTVHVPTTASSLDFAPSEQVDISSLAPKPIAPQPIILDAEVLEMAEAPTLVPRFQQKESLAEVALPTFRATVELHEVSVPLVPQEWPTTDRRSGYRKLRHLVQLIAAWEQLGPFAGAPDAMFDVPSRIFALWEAHAIFRSTWNRLNLDQHYWQQFSPQTFALWNQPTAWSLLRGLTHEQRKKLAEDWAEGLAHLRAESIAWRRLLRETRPARGISTNMAVMFGLLPVYPEVILIVMVVMIVLIGLIRIL